MKLSLRVARRQLFAAELPLLSFIPALALGGTTGVSPIPPLDDAPKEWNGWSGTPCGL